MQSYYVPGCSNQPTHLFFFLFLTFKVPWKCTYYITVFTNCSGLIKSICVWLNSLDLLSLQTFIKTRAWVSTSIVQQISTHIPMMQLFIVTVLCFEETVVYTIAVYASSIRTWQSFLCLSCIFCFWTAWSFPLAALSLRLGHNSKLLNTDTVRWISLNKLL